MDDLGRNPAVTDTVILGNVPPSTASYRGCWLEREEQKRRVKEGAILQGCTNVVV